ncbi:MAG TPA: 2-C-methyl-D-erythritol 4-phosphate cytidylyltransferase [Kiritimatiellia bacterium]|nr:2-C-methyl-D-erythritol 4-phosphate cytidylyltransferase [Kiritimatiellia bacterium]HRZ13267.1 2-C-methyl-D-erythritol 4-phosphate cytidylyltransferase [Kiritimatiellia bacterium]HSA18716.1 2-C-methyl-D-erythritol 4-phosphate cytidylyltransferase [Kiritimatiellia bacterium]
MIYTCWGVVLACGKDEQFTPEISTPFINLSGKPILVHALTAFEQCVDISYVLVVAEKTRIDSVLGMAQMYGLSKVKKVIAGFGSRQASVQAALKNLDEEANLIVVHEGSRPFVKPELISEVIKSTKRYGSGVAAVPLADAVKETRKGLTVATSVTGGAYWLAQTPAAFRRDLLEKGLKAAAKKKVELDDEASALDLVKEEVRLVEGPSMNMRIRTASDFALAMALLKG